VGSGGWSAVAGGARVSLALTPDGTLFSWGGNYDDVLGRAGVTTTPGQVGPAASWLTVATGDYHAVAVMKNGTLWSWGRNAESQLGRTGDTTVPRQVGTGTGWLSTGCGTNFSLAVDGSGSAWAWGYNFMYELGLGDQTNRAVPTQIPGLTNVRAVAGGEHHALALCSDGSLWSWGNNGQGQLGRNVTVGNVSEGKTPGHVDGTYVAIACGAYHCAAIGSDGSLWSWGRNAEGELGRGDGSGDFRFPGQVGADHDWVAVACGDFHNLALKRDGSVWSWGSPTNGVLGRSGDSTVPGKVTGVPGSPGPQTFALNKVTVKHDALAVFKFKVLASTPRVSAAITISRGSKVVKTLNAGIVTAGATVSGSWHCTLAKGTYTWRVLAIDGNGTTQTSAGVQRLVVT
jgi:hypothetical protein